MEVFLFLRVYSLVLQYTYRFTTNVHFAVLAVGFYSSNMPRLLAEILPTFRLLLSVVLSLLSSLFSLF